MLRQKERNPCLAETNTDHFGEVYTAVPLSSCVTACPSVAATTTSIITTTAVSSTMNPQTCQSYPCSLMWFADITSSLPKLSTFSSESKFQQRQLEQNHFQTVNKSTGTQLSTTHQINPIGSDENGLPSQTLTSQQTFSTATQTAYNLVVSFTLFMHEIFATQFQVLMTLRNKPFQNNVEEGENTGNQHTVVSISHHAFKSMYHVIANALIEGS